MKKNSGNALVLLLIAIFVLGGLTVLVSGMSGQTDETGSTEQATISAGEIMNYAAGLANAVNLLQSRGCSEKEISFDDNLSTTDGYENSVVPADDPYRCHVFLPQGAGMKNIPAKEKWLDTSKSGQTGYGKALYTATLPVFGIGSDTLSELIITIPFIKKSVCERINATLGVYVIPQDSGTYSPASYDTRKFKGSYLFSGGLGDNTELPDYDKIVGKKALCIQASASPIADTYHFYSVLISR